MGLGYWFRAVRVAVCCGLGAWRGLWGLPLSTNPIRVCLSISFTVNLVTGAALTVSVAPTIDVFLGVLMALRAMSLVGVVVIPITCTIPHVFSLRVPPQVLQPIVLFVVIIVTRNHAFRAGTDKCLQNKSVYPFAFSKHAYLDIPLMGVATFQDTLRQNPTLSNSRQSLNSSLV